MLKDIFIYNQGMLNIWEDMHSMKSYIKDNCLNQNHSSILSHLSHSNYFIVVKLQPIQNITILSINIIKMNIKR